MVQSKTIKLDREKDEGRGDQLALSYLGAAVVVEWNQLSPDTQRLLMDRAAAVGPLPPITSLVNSLQVLIRKHGGIV